MSMSSSLYSPSSELAELEIERPEVARSVGVLTFRLGEPRGGWSLARQQARANAVVPAFALAPLQLALV
jgi:hypothetical protein